MQQRITDFITYVSNLRDHDGEEVDQIVDEEEAVAGATREQLQELREQTKDIFKNLYWTRIISVQTYDPDDQKSWPIAPDLSDEHDILF